MKIINKKIVYFFIIQFFLNCKSYCDLGSREVVQEIIGVLQAKSELKSVMLTFSNAPLFYTKMQELSRLMNNLDVPIFTVSMHKDLLSASVGPSEYYNLFCINISICSSCEIYDRELYVILAHELAHIEQYGRSRCFFCYPLGLISSKRNEKKADLRALEIVDDVDAFCSILQKLRLSEVQKSWGKVLLFLQETNPLAEHPSYAERISYIQNWKPKS